MTNRLIYYVIIFIFGLSANNHLVECSSAMKRLYEDLFTDYNRLILPVANNKTKVKVTLGLKLGQILDLNLKQQILSTNVWVEQTWHDYKLQWDPQLYEGIDMIHMPAENIWIPDIVLFNNADGNYELTLVAKARLYSNGTVVWKPPTMFRSTCEIDVEYFPFDIQTCYLRFGSWTYAGDELELQHVANTRKAEIGIDLSQFYKNVEWDIIDVPAYYNEVYYECCNEPFPDITFKIVIRRKMLFYLVNLILPVALMTFMTVSVFYLPSDSNEKVTLSISILTSLIVFFLLMLEIIPASSLAVPLFGKYLLFTLALVSLSASVSVYVLNLHHRSPSVHSMSPRVRQIFLKTLPRLLRLDRPDPRERSSLNRFRQKKLAQQLLEASSAANHQKVYDLAQPLAASLNLIETIHKSYEVNPKDDTQQKEAEKEVDEEGRYFRRYVDNYVERLKKEQEEQHQAGGQNGAAKDCPNCHLTNRNLTRSGRVCCEHNACCSRANQPLSRPPVSTLSARCRQTPVGHQSGCCSSRKLDWQGNSADAMCPLIAAHETSHSCNNNNNSQSAAATCSRHFHQLQVNCGCSSDQRSQIAPMLHDDTLDMTFDYDEQQEMANGGGALVGARCEDDLPSPPPPPRQLSRLSDTLQNRSGRVSSCSKTNLNSTTTNLNNSDSSQVEVSEEALMDHQQLVDKLINSINLINNASDENDTTTTSNEMDQEDPMTNVSQAPPLASNAPYGFVSATSPLQVRGDQQQQQLLRQRRTMLPEQKREPMCDCGATSNPQGGCLHERSTCCSGGQTAKSSGGAAHLFETLEKQQQLQWQRDTFTGTSMKRPSDLLLSLRLPYDQMPAHVRAAIRSILFIADTIKNEDDENSAIEDWESVSMVVDRLFLWIFLLLCTFGSIIILALAPSLYDQRESIDDKLRIDVPPSNCSASFYVAT